MKFQEFSEKLICWYKANYRPLPWRDIQDPYFIWLSEIILQQTRVSQGLPYYLKFIEKYPTVSELAAASDNDVLRLWQGLGYYSRARNLIKCARLIVRDFDGKFPGHYDALLKLPGIGKYTAAAIASFAYQEKVAVVDGNVFRVLSRIFNITQDISDGKALEHFKKFSEKLMPEDSPDLYNQALMELGATVCLPKKPFCESCALNDHCYAFHHKKQQHLPVKTNKIKIKNRQFFYILIYNEKGCLMKKRGKGDIWAGLYDFLWITNEDELEFSPDLIASPFIIAEASASYFTGTARHILSHQRLNASFVNFQLETMPASIEIQEQDMQFYTWEEVERLPKPVLVDNYLKKMKFI